jgi:hypothetical protein
MYVNEKLVSVDTVPGTGEGGWEREVEGVNSSMIYLTHCKNL